MSRLRFYPSPELAQTAFEGDHVVQRSLVTLAFNKEIFTNSCEGDQ